MIAAQLRQQQNKPRGARVVVSRSRATAPPQVTEATRKVRVAPSRSLIET